MSNFWGPLFWSFYGQKINLKLKKKFSTPKTWKDRPQKLVIIGPDPFISQSSPDHSPQPRIDFSYCEISGPDICSLICDTQYLLITKMTLLESFDRTKEKKFKSFHTCFLDKIWWLLTTRCNLLILTAVVFSIHLYINCTRTFQRKIPKVQKGVMVFLKSLEMFYAFAISRDISYFCNFYRLKV